MTNWVKYLFQYSLFISLCAVALCWETCLLLSVPFSLKVLTLVFFASLFTYNSYPFAGYFLSSKRIGFRFAISTLKVKEIFSIVLIIFSGAAVLFLAFSLSGMFLLLLMAIALTLLYFILVFTHRTRVVMMKLPFLKPFLLAGTWSFITVFFPLGDIRNFSVPLLISLFLHRFLFMLMLCMIFDSRDVDADQKNGIKTLANTLTKHRSKLAFHVVGLMYVLSTIGLDYLQISHLQAIGLLLSGLFCWFLFLASAKNKGYYYYYFWVDGMMIFSAFAVYVATI